MSDIAGRLADVRARIARAAESVERDPAEIQLLAVSKRKPAAAVLAGLRAGLRDFGENYVQEAVAKHEELKALLEGSDLPTPRWHLIGPLQRNKSKPAAALFSCIQSVDRESLAEELARRAADRSAPLEVLLQVNLGRETQKAGLAPDAVPALLARCAEWPALTVVGLMAIPEAQSEAEASRARFAQLAQLRDRLRDLPGGARIEQLSMGMSGDFEVAIQEGATIVRVGTAIFGAREETAQ